MNAPLIVYKAPTVLLVCLSSCNTRLQAVCLGACDIPHTNEPFKLPCKNSASERRHLQSYSNSFPSLTSSNEIIFVNQGHYIIARSRSLKLLHRGSSCFKSNYLHVPCWQFRDILVFILLTPELMCNLKRLWGMPSNWLWTRDMESQRGNNLPVSQQHQRNMFCYA